MSLDLASIQMKMAELREALENSIPGYSVILNQIHKEISQQPELVYKLADEDIAILIKGLETFHKVEVVEVRDKKPISKKVGASLSADDV